MVIVMGSNAGALAVLWMVGAYATAFGVLLVGWHLHGWRRGSSMHPGAHGALPTSA